jgi:hypothetical protein
MVLFMLCKNNVIIYIMRQDKLIALLKRNLFKLLGENRRLRQEYKKLAAEMTKLKENKSTEIVELQEKHRNLEGFHTALQYAHDALQGQHEDLKKRRYTLSSSYIVEVNANNTTSI